MTSPRVENLVIIGSGPAGYTAALYAGRANLKPVLFEGFEMGTPGGQLMTTTDVENFPGFPDGLTGQELMARMKTQADRWGAEIYPEDVEAVDLSRHPFMLQAGGRIIYTHSLVVATGATAKRLDLPSEAVFWGRGISTCAVCDGAIPLFRGATLAVVGGGDTAAEEAIYLTRFGSHVHLLVRRDRLRANRALQERVLSHPKITVHWHTEAIDVVGTDDRLTGILIQNTKTNQTQKLPVGGVFYAIGHTPNTGLFRDQLELDEDGYIVTLPGSVETNIAGVFAAGDVQDREFRQAVTAAGTGCMAALMAERWLSAEGLIQDFYSLQDDEDSRSETADLDESSDAAQVSERLAILAQKFDITRTRHQGGYALRKLFHESDRLLMVKYASPQCGPCHTLKPIIEKVVNEFDGKIHYVEIDIEAEPDIAEAGGVIGTPTVQFFKQKDLIGEMRGVHQKSEYRQVIKHYV